MLRFLLLALALMPAASSQPLPLEGIAHIGYRVSDLDKAAAYYSGVLGLPHAFQTGDGAVMYKVSDDQYVEIAPGLKASDDVRLTHVAVQTTDIEAARRMLRSRGIAAPRAAKDSAGDLSFTLKAPEGTRIDFVEYRPGSLEWNARGKLLGAARISDHLQHTGVIVARDQLDAVLRFYRDTLGCKEMWRYEPKPGDLRLIKLWVPGKRRDIIELMIHSGPQTRQQIGGAHHINFEVADIHAAFRFALAHGARVPANFHPVVNAEDIWAFNLFDPDGSRTEVQDLTKIPMAGVTEETFHGRRAWVLSNGWIRVSVLAGGGHIAEARLISDDPKKNLNPMRVPHYPTIEPHEYDAARHDAIYGGEPNRWIASGYMGQLLCFPIYGPPSADEARAGLGHHGEAPIVEWKKMKIEVDAAGATLWYGADLPKTRFRVERSVNVPRGMRVARVREWVENLEPFDRPINWMEHATFGPPFAEPGKTIFDTSGTRGQVKAGKDGSLRAGSAVEWPKGVAPEGTPADLRAFQARPHSGAYYALRLDPARNEQFFTMYHPGYRVMIGYLFPSAGSPWIGDLQENRSITTPPWKGEVVARGIEFGSSPFDEGLRKSVERGALFDTPSYEWIGARQRLDREYTIFLSEIPEGFAGVKNVHSEHGVPIVTPNH
jgi:catechol 2,3-dioxygenase-like lactoylglutathione lyase family enzyme